VVIILFDVVVVTYRTDYEPVSRDQMLTIIRLHGKDYYLIIPVKLLINAGVKLDDRAHLVTTYGLVVHSTRYNDNIKQYYYHLRQWLLFVHVGAWVYTT
jgi:hypothetical protein